MADLNVILYWLVIAAVIVGESLLAIWTASSQRPRLVRALAVWTTVVLLMAIEACVAALLFTMTAVSAWAIVAGTQRWLGPQPSGGRIYVADLFIVVLFAATILAILRQAMAPPWAVLYLPILGLPLAPVISFAHLSVVGPARVRMVIAMLLAILVSISTLLGLNNWGVRDGEIILQLALLACLVACIALVVWLSLKLRAGVPARWLRLTYAIALAITAGIALLLVARYVDEFWSTTVPSLLQRLHIVAVISAPLFGLAALTALTTWVMRIDWNGVSTSKRRAARWLAYATGFVVLVPAVWLYWQMLWPTPFPPPPAGTPNHYERIVAICKELHARSRYTSGGSSSIPSELKALVDEAMVLLKAPNYTPTIALEEESRLRMESKHVLIGHDVRVFTTYLRMQSDLLYRQGDYDGAADCDLALLRFYEMLSRGGSGGWLSVAENGSLLAVHRNHVSPAKGREIAAALQRALAGRESLDIHVERELVKMERRQGWQSKLRAVLPRPSNKPEVTAFALGPYTRAELSLRSLQVLYATGLFQDERQQLPMFLPELTPNYLPHVPLDPYSQKPLVYVPDISTYRLYSVGPNGIDDGGQGDDIDLCLAAYQN